MDACDLLLLEKLKGRTVIDFRISGEDSVNLKLDDGTGIWFAGENGVMVGEGAADDPA